MTELQTKATMLRARGLKYREIAEVLGCSVPGAWLAVNRDRGKEIRNKHAHKVRGVDSRDKWVVIATKAISGQTVSDTEFFGG